MKVSRKCAIHKQQKKPFVIMTTPNESSSNTQ